MARTCLVPECEEKVRWDHLACLPHWHHLSYRLRFAMKQEWQREPGSKAHLKLVREAERQLRNFEEWPL